MAMIKMEHVNKYFGDLHVLKDVNLEKHKGALKFYLQNAFVLCKCHFKLNFIKCQFIFFRKNLFFF